MRSVPVFFLAIGFFAGCLKQPFKTETTAAPKPRPAGPVEQVALAVPAGPVGPHVGQTAPEIAGADIDGVPFRLSDYRGKVVVLDFWGHW